MKSLVEAVVQNKIHNFHCTVFLGRKCFNNYCMKSVSVLENYKHSSFDVHSLNGYIHSTQANNQEIKVVHRCLTEGDNYSILGAYYTVSKAARQVMNFMAI